MKILGLATMGSSAAALIENGEVVFASEEERFSRIKNDGSFPLGAINGLLEETGISFSDIDLICVYWDRNRLLHRTTRLLWSLLRHPHRARSKINRLKNVFFWSTKIELKRIQNQGSWKDLFFIKRILRREFGEFSAKIKFFNHHACHVASIFDLSSVNEALVLSYDGGGEDLSTLLLYKNESTTTEILKEKWPNSLGHFYSFFTGYLGFQMLEDEYRVMGLAPYGKPIYRDVLLKEILELKDNGRYRLNTAMVDYHGALQGSFGDGISKLLGLPRLQGEHITDQHKNIAASVQAVFEEAVANMIRIGSHKYPDVSDLCIVGGCALNVVANAKALESSGVDNVFVPPAPHDAGCAIGAGIIGYQKFGDDSGPPTVKGPYLGQEFSNDDIISFIMENGYSYPNKLDEAELLETTAEKIAMGYVVAWFQGKTEFGPRALGNRSILADPRNVDIQGLMNRKIKKRELFRPFAPSVKEEQAGQYFHLSQPSPCMNIVANVKQNMWDVIPAVTHVDKTARVHTVSRNSNPRYWRLINEFEKITGIAVLLNTSFNIQEPIVNTPSEAIRTFCISDIDMLVLNDFVFDAAWKVRNRA